VSKWLKTAILGYLAWEGVWTAHALIERKIVFAKAERASRRSGKPLLVVGAPYGMYGCGDTNLDIHDSGECASHVTGSIENIPFPDKHFGVAFASHVLEHACDPEKALAELHRAADKVFILYPRAWRTITWASPGHTWYMIPRGESFEFRRLRRSCNLPKFFGQS